MLPNPNQPVQSFLKGCALLAGLVTLALMVWTLGEESGRAYCQPSGAMLVADLCVPTGEFLATGALWFVLIYGALALPIVSILVMKHFAQAKGKDRTDD